MSAETVISVEQLAARLRAPFEGDGARLLRGVATLAEATGAELAWLGDPRYLPQLAQTRAAAVLVPPDVPNPGGLTLVRVADPDLALCGILSWFAPPAPTIPPGVHATAEVSADARVDGAAIGPRVWVGPGVVIGAGSQLHPGVYVGAQSRIGADCVLWPNVVVRERVTIGDRVVIHPNSTIGADGFGYLSRGGRNLKIPQVGTVVIEDDVEIGANSTIDRARSGVTRVRRGAKIDNLVQIGHNCDIGEDSVLIGQCGVSGSVRLGRGVVLAGQVGVADHVAIGDRAQVAAKSGVPHDVPAGAIYRGIPAIDHKVYAREVASLRRLPELIEKFRRLSRRVEQLESPTNDPTRG